MGRLETKRSHTNFLGPLVLKINRLGNTMSLHWYIPATLHQPMYVVSCTMTGKYHFRNIVSPNTSNFVTRGPRKFLQGHIVLERPVTPPVEQRTHTHTDITVSGQKLSVRQPDAEEAADAGGGRLRVSAHLAGDGSPRPA